jgi:hypothetical protein
MAHAVHPSPSTMRPSALLLLTTAAAWIVTLAIPGTAHADPDTLLRMCARDAKNLLRFTEQRPGSQSGAIERWAQACIQGKAGQEADARAIKSMPGYREALAAFEQAKRLDTKAHDEGPARDRLDRCRRHLWMMKKADSPRAAEVHFQGFEVVCVAGASKTEPLTPELKAEFDQMKSFPEWQPIDAEYQKLKAQYTQRATQKAADDKRRMDEGTRRDGELYNLRQRDCDDLGWVSDLNGAFQRLRCDGRGDAAQYRDDRDTDDWFGRVRTMLLAYVNDESHRSEITRATYAFFCMRHLKLDERDKASPMRVLSCAWWADRVDRKRLASELGSHPEREDILNRVDGAIAYLKQRRTKDYPPGTRDHFIHYELRTTVLAAHRALRAKYADDFAVVDAFQAKVEKANVSGCEEPLTKRVLQAMRGVGGTPAEIQRAIGEGARFQLVEALAKCHYYNDRHSRAASLLRMLIGANGLVSFVDKVYYAQYEEMLKDDQKAEKIPQQRGRTLSTMRSEDLPRPTLHPKSELEDKWNSASGNLAALGSMNASGIVKSVTKTGKGYRITFRKERLPVGHRECRKTNRITRIKPDGELEYEVACRTVKTTMEWVGADPIVVPEARAVEPGLYVQVLELDRDSPPVVHLVSKSAKENSPVLRLSEFEM